MVYLSRFRHDPAKILEFLGGLERLAASLMIRRVRVNARIERYTRLLETIETDQDLGSDESPLQLTQAERSETETAVDGDVYRLVPRRYVLLRLDSALCEGSAIYDHPVISVEQVLPENPRLDSQWETWWPDRDERLQNVHRLGNLALLPRKKNSRAGSYDFQKKKGYFAPSGVSPFALTTMVLAHDTWMPQTVEERQMTLVAQLKKLWRL